MNNKKIRYNYLQYKNIIFLNCLFNICIIYLNNKIVYNFFSKTLFENVDNLYFYKITKTIFKNPKSIKIDNNYENIEYRTFQRILYKKHFEHLFFEKLHLLFEKNPFIILYLNENKNRNKIKGILNDKSNLINILFYTFLNHFESF